MSETQNSEQSFNLLAAQYGMFGPEAIPELKAKILASIPTAVVATMADKSDDEKVYAYAPTYFKNLNGMQGNATPQPQQVPTVPTENITAIPAGDAAKLAAFQESTQSERLERTQKTKITKVIGDKPYPGEYFTKEMTMVPTTSIEKLNEYEAALVEGDENRANFNAAKEAVLNKKAIPIYIPSREKWSPKLLGLVFDTPAEQGAQNAEVPMTMAKSLAYTAISLVGYVANTPNTIGAELALVKSRKKKQAGAGGNTYEPRLKVANRKKAFSDANLHVYASRMRKNGDKVVTKEGTVRGALSFKIKSTKTKDDGTPIIRTVRLTGTAQVPVYERISAEMTKLFGTGENNRDIISVPVTEKAKSALANAITRTAYTVMQNSSTYGNLGQELKDKISSMTPEAANDDDNLETE